MACMLLRYIVSNFKSIGHPVEFSMLPAEGDTDERWLKTISTRAGDWEVLQRGGFFGPNASGKSSFIESVQFARDFIVNGRRSGRGTGITQFAGDLKDLNNLSKFQFTFMVNDNVYDYGFTLDRFQVYEEWLMQMNESGFQPLFTRTQTSIGKTEIEVEAGIAPASPQQRNLADILKESIQKKQQNQLFLNKLSENGIETAEEVMKWFQNIQVIFPESTYRRFPVYMLEDKEFRTFIKDKLYKLDTGIFDVSVTGEEFDLHEYAEGSKVFSRIKDELEESQDGYVPFVGGSFLIKTAEKEKTVQMQIEFDHKLNGEKGRLKIDQESDGTIRLLDLLPMMYNPRKESYVFFVDEVDRSLHTKLSQTLLQEFLEYNDGQSQVIFTAHDVNLINLEHFRQDEIWFIEKNSHGESMLKPMSDFDVAEGQDTIKAYLAGRFGAVPVIRRDL